MASRFIDELKVQLQKKEDEIEAIKALTTCLENQLTEVSEIKEVCI